MGLGYALWMVVFSIYRYIVPVEMLTPIVVFIFFDALLPHKSVRRVSAVVLAVTSAFVLAGGVQTWGHER